MIRSISRQAALFGATASISSILALAAASSSTQISTGGEVISIHIGPTSEPTVALAWTERIRDGYSVVRLGYDNGEYSQNDYIAYQSGVSPGFTGIEFSEEKILVTSSARGGYDNEEFSSIEEPRYAGALETGSYDMQSLPDGTIWAATTYGQIQRKPTMGGYLWREDTSSTYRLRFERSYRQETVLYYPNCGSSLQVVGEYIYFDTLGGAHQELASIYRRKLDGSDSPSPIFTNLEAGIVDFEVSGDYLYFGDQKNGSIRRIALDGTNLTTVVTDIGSVTSIDVTDAGIYWSDHYRIRRSSLTGTDVTTLISGLNGLRGVAVVPLSFVQSYPSEEIYFTELSENYKGRLNQWNEFTVNALSGRSVTVEVLSGPATVGKYYTGERYISFTGTGKVTLQVQVAGGYSKTFDIISTPLTEQTISFPPPETQYFGGKPVLYAPLATSSSGLPVRFNLRSTSPIGIATQVSPSEISITGTGTITLWAMQDGDTNFADAPVIAQTVSIVWQHTQNITFAAASTTTYGAPPMELDASSSEADLAVQLEVQSGPGLIDGKSLRITGAGTIVIKATQSGDKSRAAASAIIRTITVNKAVLAVSCDPIYRLVRQPNPSFPPRYSGFVNADNEADLASTRPVGKTKATASSPAGEYPITFNGGLDANYRFVPGAPSFLTVLGFGGAYEALLVDDSGVPRGKLELLVPADALTYSGTLNLASEPASLSIRGKLSASVGSSAIGSWSRAANPAKGISALSLGFELTADTLDGELSVNNSPALSIGSGSRLFVQPVVASKKQNAPWTGLHTLVLRDPTPLAPPDLTPGPSLPAPSSLPLPLGAGHASASIASTGLMTLKGKLADGTTLTGTAAADASGRYRLYARPYAKRINSFLAGELPLVAHPEQTRFANRFHVPEGEATFAWAKASSPAKPLDPAYRSGFAADLIATLDPWLAPAAKATIVNGVSLPAGTLAQRLDLTTDPLSPASLAVAFGPADLDLGGSADLLPTLLGLSTQGVFSVAAPVTTPLNATKFSLKLTPSTGAFSGSFTLSDVRPPATKPTLRPVSFSGTLRQAPEGDPNLGAGFFLLPDFDKTAEQPSAELILSVP